MTHDFPPTMLYARDLPIVNIDALPKGTGARFLKCLISHDGARLIAKTWHRKEPAYQTGHCVVQFYAYTKTDQYRREFERMLDLMERGRDVEVKH